MARDTAGGTFLVATILCVVCSVLVSAAAVALRPKQEANKELDRQKNILIAARLCNETATDEEVRAKFQNVEQELIDLDTGEPVDKGPVNPETYDPRDAASKPRLSELVEPPGALPSISRRERYAFVYLVKQEGKLDKVVLPIYGKGLWSTLYGFIALEADLKAIAGITFYQHAETPGLGGEVDNPEWKALWHGKQAFDNQGKVEIRVLKGAVNPHDPAADHEVDGLSGASITTRGVSDLVRYWLGPDGFGRYLENMRSKRDTSTTSILSNGNTKT